MGRNPDKWTTTKCKQCRKEFDVYKKAIEKGKGKFCSISCSTTYRNIHNNPTKSEEVREKISKNHADFSGENNPMFGVRGENAPGYIDGRILGEDGLTGSSWRKIAKKNKKAICEVCEKIEGWENLQVHHIDGDRENNEIENLKVVCPKCHNNFYHKKERNEDGTFK